MVQRAAKLWAENFKTGERGWRGVKCVYVAVIVVGFKLSIPDYQGDEGEG